MFMKGSYSLWLTITCLNSLLTVYRNFLSFWNEVVFCAWLHYLTSHYNIFRRSKRLKASVLHDLQHNRKSIISFHKNPIASIIQDFLKGYWRSTLTLLHFVAHSDFCGISFHYWKGCMNYLIFLSLWKATSFWNLCLWNISYCYSYLL